MPGAKKLHLRLDATPVVNAPIKVPEDLKSRLKAELDHKENYF